jgi:hypothetical protein
MVFNIVFIGGSENLIIHVKTYQDIQAAGGNNDAKGTPRYLCLTRKKKNNLKKANQAHG